MLIVSWKERKKENISSKYIYDRDMNSKETSKIQEMRKLAITGLS
jgi:hypothetical protein